eukprot:CAMPEP_0119302848 /NCGR_PEP_ID=MMETSP1333-20130426/4372_1 /TAXON_ID=418940 /ORGANISM="Scyphosphaera apsteinii, Strain RCC1455" /LENGTH=630 /DNA_ID=CAMNT_0007305327 /DNA_START=240 /DNA_END=2132 /DNA_ORIENTATION=+
MFSEPPPEPSAEDVFEDLSTELTSLQRILKQVPPLAMGATTNTLTAMTAIVAWFLTPSVSRMATLLTVGAAGTFGRQLGRRLTQQRQQVVPAAIGELLREGGLKGVREDDVAMLADRYGLSPEQFELQLKTVYSRFLQALLEEPEDIETAEVASLSQLRRAIGLPWNTTQRVHVEEARLLLDGQPLTSVNGMSPVLKKLLWISMTLFSTSNNQADSAELQKELGIDDASVQQVLNQLSAPLYASAVTQSIVKYNRTQVPQVLQTIRKTLKLDDTGSQEVHNAIYEAQLSLLLPAGSRDSKITESTQQVLGNLEGILQIRAASSMLQSRTVPLYQQAVIEALDSLDSLNGSSFASIWGGLALRQQELALPRDRAKASLIEQARRKATAQLSEAATAQANGELQLAMQRLQQLYDFSSRLGGMLEQSGWERSGISSSSIVEKYLGALSVGPDLETAAQQLAQAVRNSANDELKAGESSIMSMLALSTPGRDSAKQQYTQRLEAILQAADLSDEVGDSLRALRDSLELPSALCEKLALNAYYDWLLDLSEREERGPLENARAVRNCLQIEESSVGELYTNTDVDELVLSKCCQLLRADQFPLTTEATQWLQYIETQLQARPGLAAQVLRNIGT